MTELTAAKLINNEKLLLAAKILLSAGLIWYIASIVNFNEIIAGIQKAKLPFVISALILSIFNLYIQYLKWMLTSGLLLNENKRSRILVSLFYGFTGGSFTPGRVGEYFGRALAFRNENLLRVSAATFIDKVFPLFITLFFGSVSVVIFVFYYYKTSIYLTSSLFILLLILSSAVLFIFFNSKKAGWVIRIKRYKPLDIIAGKLHMLKNITTAYIVKMILFSLLFYACFIVQYALLGAAFSDNISFINLIWAGNLVMFAKTIISPVSLGELGIREGASVFFLTQLGGTASAGFNASIFLFTINVLLPSAAGMFLMLKRDDN